MFFTFLHFIFKVTLLTNIAFLPPIWNSIFKTVFPKLFFLFSNKSSKLSRNLRKLRMKLRNATIYPTWGQIKKIILYSSLIWNARLDIWTVSTRRIRDIFNQGALQVTLLRKVRRCVDFSRKWTGKHFYMAKWTLM